MKTNVLPKVVVSPDPVLGAKVRAIPRVDDEIRDMVKVMRKVMVKNQGVGLAANQIGIPVALFVAQIESDFYVFINPKITKISRDKDEMVEGCLSVPGYWGIVPRHKEVTIEGVGLNGKKQKIKAKGLLAQIFQHEMDHLEGKLYIQRTDKVRKLELQK